MSGPSQASPGTAMFWPCCQEDWERQKHIIEQLYWVEDCDLPTVMELLAEEHNFHATVKQYKKRLKDWGLVKNVKSADMQHLVRIRKRRREDGKDTTFQVRKRPVKDEKIDRWVSRKEFGQSMSGSRCGSTPPEIEYSTPERCGSATPPRNPTMNEDNGPKGLDASISWESLQPSEGECSEPIWGLLQPGEHLDFGNWADFTGQEDGMVIDSTIDLISKSASQVLFSGIRRPVDRRRKQRSRTATSNIRKMSACIRCRLERVKCSRLEPCSTCRHSRPTTLRFLPCLRYRITEVVVFLNVQNPYRAFVGKSGCTWAPDRVEWVSSDVHLVKLSELSLDVTCSLEVRKFASRFDQTLTQETWSDGLTGRTHQTPPYAIADMGQARRSLADVVGRKVANYIIADLGKGNELTWSTYRLAFKQVERAKDQEERELLAMIFRFWCACLKFGRLITIQGSNTLGFRPIQDRQSPWYSSTPVAPLLTAQIQMIIQSDLIDPVFKEIRLRLDRMFLSNKRQHWLTLFCTLFILLRSFTTLAVADYDLARRIGLKEEYANPEDIERCVSGIDCLLAYYHYAAGGKEPFEVAAEDSFRDLAGVSAEEADEVSRIAALAKNHYAGANGFRNAAKKKCFRDEDFWVSQLFEDNWTPRRE